MEFFKIRKDIPFMRHALAFNVVSIVTFIAAVVFLVARGLNLGVEVLYAEADPRGRQFELVGSTLGSVTRLGGDVGAIEGRIRVQRDF